MNQKDRRADLARGFAVTPVGNSLGADVVGVDLNHSLSEAKVAAIQKAWNEHLVLRIRGQYSLTLPALIAFSRHFGPLDERPTPSVVTGNAHSSLPPEIVVISNIKVDGKPIGGLGDGEAAWHADMTYNERPPRAACLYAMEVPPAGGNTWFLNMYRAYETLPVEVARRIDGLRCVHDASRNSAGELRRGFKDISDPRRTVGAVHPLVSTHPDTGRKCLLLGRRRGAYVVGLSLVESEALLDFLWTHATSLPFAWAQEWRVGDVVMWDNACTMHRRDPFDASSRRLMYRTQIAGGAVLV